MRTGQPPERSDLQGGNIHALADHVDRDNLQDLAALGFLENMVANGRVGIAGYQFGRYAPFTIRLDDLGCRLDRPDERNARQTFRPFEIVGRNVTDDMAGPFGFADLIARQVAIGPSRRFGGHKVGRRTNDVIVA